MNIQPIATVPGLILRRAEAANDAVCTPSPQPQPQKPRLYLGLRALLQERYEQEVAQAIEKMKLQPGQQVTAWSIEAGQLLVGLETRLGAEVTLKAKQPGRAAAIKRPAGEAVVAFAWKELGPAPDIRAFCRRPENRSILRFMRLRLKPAA